MNTYLCWTRDTDSGEEVVAATAGQAKSQYYDSDWGIPYIAVKARLLSRGVSKKTTPEFLRVAEKRGLPFARVGMKVLSGNEGRKGVIVGHNESANFDVLFDGLAGPENCHPHYNLAYLDESGKIIKDYRAEAAKEGV